MRTYALPLVFLGSVTLTSSASAAPKVPAAGKAPPACGAKVLPLVVGNSWTYNPVAAPTSLPEAMQRLAPNQPKQIVVTVKSVEKQGADTVVTLEEKHGYDLSKDSKTPKVVESTVTGTIVCNDKGKFDIAPELFFFSGEPGGVFSLKFDQFTRKKETSLKLTKGTIGEAEWIEEITSHFTRTPAKGSENTKLAGGKLEIERKFTPQPQEKISTKMGTYTAEKLGVITSGRVTFDTTLSPEGKPCSMVRMDPVTKTEVKEPSAACELPANWISTLWLAEGVGIVQTLNSYAHMYQLVDAQLK
ncbi:MAG TPA: hypothetical protein VK427_18815 [Kofleriaceae bacterium]|nr:hypothetical protein [Kofleriaceae bacterium]